MDSFLFFFKPSSSLHISQDNPQEIKLFPLFPFFPFSIFLVAESGGLNVFASNTTVVSDHMAKLKRTRQEMGACIEHERVLFKNISIN